MDFYKNARTIALSIYESSLATNADDAAEAIRNAVEKATGLFPGVSYEELLQDLYENVNINVGQTALLKDNDAKHVPWLPQVKGTTKWELWRRYERYLLENKRWPLKVVQSLDKTTDDILGFLENPKDLGRSYDRRGLVVGYVQSGKTANFTGVINKALDAGYQLVIVLAGMHNSLRSQTQMRLDEEVLGYETSKKELKSQQGAERIGVSTLTGERYVNIGYLTSRDDNGDFNRTVAKTISVHPGEGHPFLLVVKKNASVLKNLVKYFRDDSPLAEVADSTTNRKVVKNVPLLLIDDEADQASVNTADVVDEDGKLLEDYDPNKINKLIRELYVTFEQRAYVGYTATPFANIYAHNAATHEQLGAELFPSSFIISLPKPSNYVGPAEVFGLDKDDESQMPLIRHLTDTQQWMPDKHKKDHIPGALPDSLKQAIHSFILSTALRRIRGQVKKHNSMLIHVTRFTLVQKKIYEAVHEYVDEVRREIRYEDPITSLVRQDLKNLWLNDYVPTSAEMNGNGDQEDWDQIEAQLLLVIESIKVKEINGSTGDILDYKEHDETGLNVIAIGGDKLSRGLTLDGLTVSYYLRASKMYDTLMQMGRWFGYRDGYQDLCRIYTTKDLVMWFRHIAIAMEELRDELSRMASIGATPEEFGLRVMSHPIMFITSQVKMKSSVPLKLSYAGTISETTVFEIDDTVLNTNFDATDRFIRKLGEQDENYFEKRDRAIRGKHLMWDNVDGQHVIDFLDEYKTHKYSTRANAHYISQYIRKQYQQGELTSWSVCLVNVGDDLDEQRIGGHKVGRVERNTPKEPGGSQVDGVVSIKRLVTPDHELFDFTKAQLDEIDIEVEKWKEQNEKKKHRNSIARTKRDKKHGLLLIYPLKKTSHVFDGTNITQTPIGIALSFPDSDTAQKVDYRANNVFMELEDND